MSKSRSTTMIVTTAYFALLYATAAAASSASSSVSASSFLRRSSSTTKNSNIRTLVEEETEDTTAAPCHLQVDFGACPLPPPRAIENGCESPFQRITFRYTDSTCAQSAHFVHRHDGTTCTDYETDNAAADDTDNQVVVNRSVPTKRLASNRLGSSSSASSSSLLLSHTNAYPAEESITTAAAAAPTTKYITVTSQSGNETYFTGTVGLGDEYTLNAQADYAVLRGALTITVYEKNGGSIVQQTNVVLDCSTNPVFLLDTFGAHQVTAWTEITGRNVALPTHSIQTATIPITITNPFSSISSSSSSSSSTQLVAMSVISNMDDAEHPMEDYTSEIQNIRLQPGQSMTPREYVFEYHPSGPRTRYTFLTTVIGTSTNANTNNGSSNQQCHASATIECIL